MKAFGLIYNSLWYNMITPIS